MRKRFARWLLIGGCTLAFAVTAAGPSTAQTLVPHFVQGSDGTLYVVNGTTRYLVTPDPISDSDLAWLNDGGSIGSLLDFPSTSARAAAPSASATTSGQQPNNAGSEIVVERVLWAPVGQSGAYIVGAALLRNPNPDLWMPGVSETTTAFDASGNVLASTDDIVSLGAGEERWVLIQQMSAPAAKVARLDYQIRRDKSFRPSTTDPAPTLTVVQSSTQVGQYGTKQLGQVRNDGSTTASQVRVDTVYLDANGQFLGSAHTYVDNLPPGQTASFSASVDGNVKAASDVKTYVSAPLARIVF